jgi:hypothetical protein
MLLVAVLAALPATSFGREPDFREFRVLQESLAGVPPKYRAEWLQKRGYDDSRYTRYQKPESTGLRLVGKYGRGPSVAVTGRDTLVALTLGSEVALLNFADPDQPRVLSEIQVNFLPGMSILLDSFVLIGGNGIEVWDITDPTQPVFRHVVPYAVSGFAVWDTFLYFVSLDTFHVYSIGRPQSPYRVGFCLVSGNVGAATRSTVVLRQPGDLLGFIDVSDPAAPRLAGTYPGFALAFAARNSICCAAFYWSTDEDHFRFEVLDISDPTNVRRLAAMDSIGGYDVYLDGPIAFVSGYYSQWEFTIVDIQDSTRPHVVSSCATPGGNYGVWADWTSDWAYVADRLGLAAIDISNLTAPRLDTILLKANYAQDIWLDGGRAYVADYTAGLRILDVTDVTRPAELGGIDSANLGTMTTVARDSFAFAGGWPGPPLRVIQVSDPARPAMVGGCAAETDPADMVLRDTLVYLAGRLRFNVVNVARPREPELVGSCVTGDLHMAGLWLQGDLAYIAGQYDGIYIVDVADPQNPSPLKVLGGMSAWGCCVRDSLLFVSDFDDSLHIWSVANLYNVYQLGAVYVRGAGYDVKVLGDYAYVGADGLGLVDISDPRTPRLLGYYATPDFVRRVVCDSPHVYAACWSAGVFIFDTVTTAVKDRAEGPVRPSDARILGSVTNGFAIVEFSTETRKEVNLQVFDIVGNRVGRTDVLEGEFGDGRRCQIDLSGRPAGVYILQVNVGNRVCQLRTVKP